MHLIKHVLASNFLRHNAILFAGSVAVGVLNYAYYPILGRLLSPSAFGEVQTLVSLFLQLSIFLTVLSLVVVTIVTNYRNKIARNRQIFELEKAAVLGGLVLLVVTTLAGSWLQHTLHFASPWPFILLALALVISVPLTFRSAFLRGKQRFAAVSGSLLLGAAGKIATSSALVVMGLGTNGAIAGLALAQTIALGFTALRARGVGLRYPSVKIYLFAPPNMRTIAPQLRFSFFVLLGSLAVMLLFSVDVIMVKYFFDAHTAGLYAGVATVARIIFFLTASVAQVLLPAVKLTAASRSNRRLLIKSLVLVVGASLPVTILLMLFPHTIVVTLMGQEYAGLAYLLPVLAVVNFTISIINLLVSYFLALRRAIIGVLAIIGFAASCGLMLLSHDSPQSITTSLLLGSVATLCLIAIWITRGLLVWRNSDETTATLDSGSGLQ